MTTQSLTTKLATIQRHLEAPKNQFNSFGKYHYRSCEDITEALKPLLADAGLVLTITDELVHLGDRYYVKATARVTDGKESTEVSAYAREDESKKGMDSAQLSGSTSSYARKYALNGLFLIDDSKDSDSNEVRQQSNAAPAAPSAPTRAETPTNAPPPQQVRPVAQNGIQQPLGADDEARHKANARAHAVATGLFGDSGHKVLHIMAAIQGIPSVGDCTAQQLTDFADRLEKKSPEELSRWYDQWIAPRMNTEASA